MQLLCVALFVAWKQDGTDRIPEEQDVKDEDDDDVEQASRKKRRKSKSKKPPPKKKKPEKDVSSDKARWYRIAVMLCSAFATLHAHSISLDEATSAVDDIAAASVELLEMGEHLTINWHIAMHYVDAVKKFGPLSGFATYAFERNNGELSRVKINGQERDVPTTLIRKWILGWQITNIVNNPHPEADPIELAGLEALRSNREVRARGTLMVEEEQGLAASRTIRLPAPYQKGHLVDLSQHEGSYWALLQYLDLNHAELNYRDAADYGDNFRSLPYRSSSYTLFTHAVLKGFKFCSLLWSRGRRDAYALARIGQRRELCKLYLILQIDFPDIKETLALVQFYPPAAGDYPWRGREIDLGIRIYRDEPMAKCLLPLENLEAPTIVSRIETEQDGVCLVSVSCDRDGQEPEFWLSDLPVEEDDEDDDEE